MTLDELDREWRATNEAAATKEQREQLIAATSRRVERLWGCIFGRDVRETIAAVFVIIFFGLYCYLAPTDYVVPKIGAGFLVCWALFIIYKLHRTRTIQQPASLDAPVCEFCRIELDRLDRQIQLLRSVLWWYIAPCMVGVNIVFTGSLLPSGVGTIALGIASLCYGLFTLLLAWWLYALNRRAVAKELLPARNELANLLSQLEGVGSDTLRSIKQPAERLSKRGHPFLLVALLVTLTALGTAAAFFVFQARDRERGEQQRETPSAVPIGGAEALLADLIPALRKEKELVGLAAMVMIDGQVIASAAHGERKKGSGVPIELGDRWHLGSITKSITATMIARLVESGRMKWTDTIGERFLDASIHEDWKPVTLRQLLTHTSGAPANFSIRVMLKQPALGPECTRERRKAVLDVIAEKPAHAPGEKYAYSNVGYTIAGAMAESATGVIWEDLVKREVFEPLELTDAGFGPPKSPSETLDQPRGHRVVLGWKVSANDDADNTPIMGPAGAVHMTLGNLCKYATEHLRGELGAGKLLAAETYKRLHTPALQNYACGWVVKQPTNEIPYTVYWHNGSNTMWYALVVFIPGKNMVVAVTSNDGDIKQAESAAWKIVNACANQLNKSLPSQAFPKE